MGYIGTKPSAVPLTSADITDGIITSAKIADGTIVNADINASAAIVSTKLSGVGITLGTSVASTSGTSIDFTGIPSTAKRITVMFDGVSLSGTSNFLIQLGDSGGIENSGYLGAGVRIGASTLVAAASTAGFNFNNITAATLFSGSINITNVTGNTWVSMGLLSGNATEIIGATSGGKTLSDVLTQVRITTVNGTDTFDAGTINISYE